jgi:hypothetical protein
MRRAVARRREQGAFMDASSLIGTVLFCDSCCN